MTDCYCDYERPTVYSQTKPVARVQHKCSECRGHIKPGEKYTKIWGVWDGDQATYKRCPDCEALLDYVEAHVPCFCWYNDFLLENAIDEIRAALDYESVPGMWMEFGRLYVKCKRRGKAGREERMAQRGIV
jgi:hypothetical protein